jgi:hypothetical protein
MSEHYPVPSGRYAPPQSGDTVCLLEASAAALATIVEKTTHA